MAAALMAASVAAGPAQVRGMFERIFGFRDVWGVGMRIIRMHIFFEVVAGSWLLRVHRFVS